MGRAKVVAVVVAALMAGCAVAGEGLSEELRGKTLIVGTRHVPPFAIKGEDGTWSGITIRLWSDVAAELGLKYEFRERDLAGLLRGVEDHSLDAATAALTVTAEREKAMDFTHPFHTTGLGIATVPENKKGWTSLLERFVSWGFVKVVAALSAVLLLAGLLVWVFERRRNPAQFGRGAVEGIGAGFWWSAVTMTTVGYGDKAPVTLGGRLVALVWMFAALIVVATFTGAIASALTVGELGQAVNGPEDLPNVDVGTVAGSTSEAYLRARRISYQACQDAREGLEAVAAGKLDAFVYDAPLLRYLANTEFKGRVEVLPRRFERQDYGIALPEGSPLREPMNRVLLRRISGPEWQDVLYRYLGK